MLIRRTLAATTLAAATAFMGAWNAPGHRAITLAALEMLPPEAPAWLRSPDAHAQTAYQAAEPDRWRGTRMDSLVHVNAPNHFLDVELLDKSGLTLRTLPPLRYAFVAAVARAEQAADAAPPRRGVTAPPKEEAGYLPYAIMEHHAKLVSSFNTLRILEQLNDPSRTAQLHAARANVLHEMGQLSHVVGDAAQPLHTTIHHHGWVGPNPDGFTTDRSFHQYVDGGAVALHALNAKAITNTGATMRVIPRDAPNAVWEETLAHIERSHAAMRPLYALEKNGDLQKEPGRAFLAQRMADAASLLAGLYWDAWQRSEPTPQQVADFVRYDAHGAEELPAGSMDPTLPLPTSMDLRETLMEMELPPRAQGPRGTCSIFTTCHAIEFALARHRAAAQASTDAPRAPASPDAPTAPSTRAVQMSPEFLNWAAGRAAGRPSDGNFFHNALAGFEKFGVCSEQAMPYEPRAFNPTRVPSAAALAEAERVRQEAAAGLKVHWIVPWQDARFGVNPAQLDQIKRVLAAGYPVAAGSGHSRLLVGYRDDPSKPGGGIFYTQDSGLGRYDEVTYAFVRKDVADVFWVEAPGTNAAPAAR